MPSLSEGARVFYTGDVANQSGWFFVAAGTLPLPPGVLTLFEEGDGFGRSFHLRPEQVGEVYRGHCSPRFVTEAAYNAYHKE